MSGDVTPPPIEKMLEVRSKILHRVIRFGLAVYGCYIWRYKLILTFIAIEVLIIL